MNKYWRAVLLEVLNVEQDSTQFNYTNLGELKARAQQPKRDYSKPKEPIKMYELGEPYSGVYFTRREAECMALFLEGNTIVKAAETLGLSPRTVEFYVKNMKIKLDCPNKDVLVKVVQTTQFLKNFTNEV